MVERPILFSAPMVRALLAGSKTQTRRVVKPQPRHDEAGMTYSDPYTKLRGVQIWFRDNGNTDQVICPYGQPGDRLWVRETWAKTTVLGIETTVYREGDNTTDYGGPWKPSIFMPRWASRITLEITGVRVERLQDIDRADAAAEGVQAFSDHDALEFAKRHVEWPERKLFRELWSSINGADSWAANPFVWVVEFKRVAA